MSSSSRKRGTKATGFIKECCTLARTFNQSAAGRRSRFASRILQIDPTVAERWGDLMAQARKGGVALSAMDGFFAATALVHHLTLATRNARDFAPLGVPILNPWIGGSVTQ